MPGTQVCRICGVEKELTDFYSNKTCVLGVDTQCKACVLAKRRTPEGRKTGAKAMANFRKRHRDDTEYLARVKAEKKADYWKDPEKHKAKNRERWANDEAFRLGQLAKQKVKFQNDEAFRQRVLADTRKRRATPEGRAAHNASNARLKKTDHGRVMSRLHAHVRRARLMSVPHDFTIEQWDQFVEAYESCCAYCGVDEVALEMDHVVPLASGGHHTIDNIVPSCGPCNRKKNRYHVDKALVILGIDRTDYLKRRGLALFRMISQQAA